MHSQFGEPLGAAPLSQAGTLAIHSLLLLFLTSLFVVNGAIHYVCLCVGSVLRKHISQVSKFGKVAMRRSLPLCLHSTSMCLLSAGKLSQYEQEAYESHRRFTESQTYPGPIRAATPGDTRFYMGSAETILRENERHYWRAVIDDPHVQHLVPLRIRFKTFIWVTSGWEQRMQVVQVMMQRDATIAELMQQVRIENQSPYLCISSFKLSIDGKDLDDMKTLADYGINEYSRIDAIEENDYLLHTEAEKPKDWNVDEMTEDVLLRSPYKEMAMQPLPNLAPRYEAKPKGYHGKNDYSGMKQSS
ncbi:putative Ubiquitin family [Leishmania naiffi]|uniref:Ubiquitin family n=1 Tax=Leishmania naiffi TaxID=5678 RepID=A0AAW3BMX3_9TRYP